MFSILLTTYTNLDNVDVSANGRRRSVEPIPEVPPEEPEIFVESGDTDSDQIHWLAIALIMLAISLIFIIFAVKRGRTLVSWIFGD